MLSEEKVREIYCKAQQYRDPVPYIHQAIEAAVREEMAKQEPCDMGDLCLGCEPRNPNGSCPDAQAKAAEALELTGGE